MNARPRLALTSGALLLTACDGGGEPQGDAAPADPSPTADARYGTVDALKNAAVEGGYDCKRWRQDDAVTLAAQSGTCSGDSVFATFASEGDLQAQIETYREFDEMAKDLEMDSDPRLVGSNWVINAPEAAELQDSLGGTVENQ